MALSGGRFTEEGTSKFIRAGGIQLRYHEAGSGPPLICLDAWGPGISAWLVYHRNIEALSEHFRVLLVDMPGRGKSDWPLPLEVPTPGHSVMTHYVRALMDELGIDKAYFMGDAVGGTSCVVMALEAPERVIKMVIGGCSASTGGNVFLFNPVSMEGIRMAGEVQRDLTRPNIERYLKLIIHDKALVTDDLVDHMYNTAINRPPNPGTGAGNISHNNLDQLPTLTQPVLMVHGRYDPVVTPETPIQMLGLIPNSRLVLMRCGNLPPYEMADEFNRISIDFLKNTN